jgi:hypothetical protein
VCLDGSYQPTAWRNPPAGIQTIFDFCLTSLCSVSYNRAA